MTNNTTDYDLYNTFFCLFANRNPPVRTHTIVQSHLLATLTRKRRSLASLAVWFSPYSYYYYYPLNYYHYTHLFTLFLSSKPNLPQGLLFKGHLPTIIILLPVSHLYIYQRQTFYYY